MFLYIAQRFGRRLQPIFRQFVNLINHNTIQWNPRRVLVFAWLRVKLTINLTSGNYKERHNFPSPLEKENLAP